MENNIELYNIRQYVFPDEGHPNVKIAKHDFENQFNYIEQDSTFDYEDCKVYTFQEGSVRTKISWTQEVDKLFNSWFEVKNQRIKWFENEIKNLHTNNTIISNKLKVAIEEKEKLENMNFWQRLKFLIGGFRNE